MVDPKLTAYIRQNIGRLGQEKVKSKLLESGWNEKQVDEALKQFSGQQVSGGPSAGKPAGGKKIPVKPIAIGAVVVVAVIAVAAVFIMFPDLFKLPEPPPPADLCGNGVCDAGETFENCPDDCQEPPPEPIGIGVDGPSSAGVGDTVAINVVATDSRDLFGFQFNMNYDPSLLRYESIAEGAFFNRNGADSTFCVPVNTDTPGLIKNYACFSTNALPGHYHYN